jgi:hypothetical protein
MLGHVREHFEATLVRHADIQQYQVDGFLFEHIERLLAILGLEDFVIETDQVLPQRPADQFLIVDDQDAFRHKLFVASRRRAPFFLGGD